MALAIKNNFVREDITDNEGNKIGELKFNPKDSRIMSKLSIILKDISNAANKVSRIKLDAVPEGSIDKIEDFEKFEDICNKWLDATTIENDVVEKVIKELKEVFGEECVNCFTQGTNDIESLMPLIEYVLPYIKEYKENKVNKYLPKNNDDVMD